MSEHPDVRKALAALEEGRITREEADRYLRAQHNITLLEAQDGARPKARERAIPLAAALIAIIAIIGLTTLFDGGLTGRVVLDTAPLAETGSMAIDGTITGLRVSGTLIGEGTGEAWFDTPTESMLVASIASDDGTPRTDKAGYDIGETITIEHAPDMATYYFDDGTTSTAITPPFAATTEGTLLVVAEENGEFITYRLPIIIGTIERTTTFDDACIETCTMNATNGTLRVVTTGDARLEITAASAETVLPNNPPSQILTLPSITVNETTTLDLAPYFTDIDGDALLYSTSTSAIATLDVEDSIVTITPISDGTETVTIYTSDLEEIIQSTLELTVAMPVAEPVMMNGTNTTIETTLNGTNTTETNTTDTNSTNETVIPGITLPDGNETNMTGVMVNGTGNSTDNTTANVTGNASIDCSDPNPNNRPLECLQDSDTNYFLEQEIYWYDDGRTAVARFTPIGNLLITGEAVPLSTQSLDDSVFRINYEDDDGNLVTTIWIDTDGNLHARGNIYEENSNLQPTVGSYSFNNRKGITLAYADAQRGDLYIRGNVIPYRRSIT